MIYMSRFFFKWVTIVLALIVATPLFASTPTKEELVTKFLDFRETLVRDGKVDVTELSKSIRQAINDGERLEREANYKGALNKLLELERFAPLSELPSFEVQMLSSWLYIKLGDAVTAKTHMSRAEAMRELLGQHIGKGDSPTDPIRALMINDISEWAKMQLARIVGVKGIPIQGREIFVVTYSGRSTSDQSRVAYFEIDRRVQSKANQQIRLYDPIPLAQMRPTDLEYFELAKQKRERFLTDTFAYLDLVGKIREVIGKAAVLDQQGKAAEALAALSEIEAIRPIEDIPLANLISVYSVLNGKTGNTQKQLALRGLIFGINQSIAHSGDGLLPETAVHVIATSEEDDWLRDRKLTKVRQRLVDGTNGKFDVLTVKDASGVEKDVYFNITRMFAKYSQGLVPTSNKP
jgi:hypothetical protein